MTTTWYALAFTMQFAMLCNNSRRQEDISSSLSSWKLSCIKNEYQSPVASKTSQPLSKAAGSKKGPSKGEGN